MFCALYLIDTMSTSTVQKSWLQERFRPIIAGMPAVIDTARRLIKGADALDLPIVLTEQYPKALGHTVEELKEILPARSLIQDKVHFSMMGLYPLLPSTYTMGLSNVSSEPMQPYRLCL